MFKITKKTSLFSSFLSLFVTTLYGQGFLVNYPKELNAEVSANYTVFVNEIPVNVYSVATNNDVAYAHFSFSGKVVVRIHLNATVNSYELSPHSYGIVSTKSGQDISFNLDKPRKLLLQNVNTLKERLCILADPLEDVIPVVNGSSVVDVTTKGVDKTGSIDNLTQIKNALNELPAGGILYFPPGRYTAGGPLPMASDKSIYLAGGAVLQAGSVGRLTLVFDGASNVKLFGRGSIDGLGDSKRASIDGEGDWTCSLVYKNSNSVSDNCTIDGVIFKGAITWNAIVMGTTNWTVYNMKVINGSGFGNHDGWDPHNAVNMMVDNCFILGSDDCIALSTLNDNMVLNTTFRNNVLTNTSSGATVRIGPTVGENTSNVNVENNDHLLSGINEHALAFWLGGAISNFKYSGNRIENARHGLILMRTNWNDFYAGPQSGSADNIVFDRLTAENISSGDGHFNTLEGLNATNHVNNITFKDFYQGGLLMTSAKAANMACVGSNVSNITFTTSATPLIGITASALITYRKGSIPGRFKVTRTGGGTSGALTIRYQIHGNAINGTDYLTIRDSVTIPAGGTSADITIIPSAIHNSSTYVNVYLSILSSDFYILGPDYDAVVSIVN